LRPGGRLTLGRGIFCITYLTFFSSVSQLKTYALVLRPGGRLTLGRGVFCITYVTFVFIRLSTKNLCLCIASWRSSDFRSWRFLYYRRNFCFHPSLN